MKKALLFTFIVGLSGQSFAAEKCQVKSVFNMVAFGSDYVIGQNLKSNGSIGSGNSIRLGNSEINNSDCRALSSNGSVTVNDSKINGSVESFGQLKIENTDVLGQVRSPNKISLIDSSVGIVVGPKGSTLINSTREKWWNSTVIKSIDLGKFKSDLESASRNFAVKEQTKNLKIIGYKENLTLSLKSVENVISLTVEELEKVKNLEVRGDENQSLVINITGDNVVFDHSTIDISGDIEPFNIVWNFTNAKSVVIKDTLDQVLGIPGRIIAPNANVKLENALVSGGIYAKSIEFNVNSDNNKTEIREIKYLDK